jgi:hypothetical protein
VQSRITLSPEELHEITGYKRPRDQAAYIRETYGVRAVLNAQDECVVIRAHLESATAAVYKDAPKSRVRRVA